MEWLIWPEESSDKSHERFLKKTFNKIYNNKKNENNTTNSVEKMIIKEKITYKQQLYL